MRPFSKIICTSKMARCRGISAFITVCLASSLALPSPALSSTPVEDLTSTFGTPKDFSDKFEASVKDRSDQIIGLLIAASGFVYAIRIFTN